MTKCFGFFLKNNIRVTPSADVSSNTKNSELFQFLLW